MSKYHVMRDQRPMSPLARRVVENERRRRREKIVESLGTLVVFVVFVAFTTILTYAIIGLLTV